MARDNPQDARQRGQQAARTARHEGPETDNLTKG